MSGSDLRLVLVGWGAIATRVAALLAERRAPVGIVGIAVRDVDAARADWPPGAASLTRPDALAAAAPDLVVEAAGRAAVAPWGEAALAAGIDFAPASTSAFTDANLLARLARAARAGGAQLLIPPGALGGIDALAGAALLPLDRVRHEIVKPPAAWRGTAAETMCDLSALRAAVTFFEGTAMAAAAAFPQNANAAMTTSLAGIGAERTTVALVADPTATRNRHRIAAEGAFGRMTVVLENRALAGNPKSSELTALSLVRLIEGRRGTVVL